MNAMHAAPLLLALVLLAGCAAAPAVSPARLVPGDQRPVRIESTTLASGGRSVEVRVSAPRGVFALDLELSGDDGSRIDRLVLLVVDERHCEGLEAHVEAAIGQPATIELLGHPDVSIGARGADLEIVLGPAALDALRPRARLQFVDQWR